MSAQPSQHDSHDVIRLGGETAVVVPVHEYHTLKALRDRASTEQVEEAEIDAAIAEAMAETGVTSLKQMGVVMKATQARLKGKTVDGKSLSDKVRSKLS